MAELGPIYRVELLDSLPLGTGGFSQEMPGRDELLQVKKKNPRVVAGLEVLTAHYREEKAIADAFRISGLDIQPCMVCGAPVVGLGDAMHCCEGCASKLED